MDLEIQEVSRESLAEWKDHPVTRLYFTAINRLLVELSMDIASGSALNESSADSTGIAYARQIGHIAGLKTALSIELDEETT